MISGMETATRITAQRERLEGMRQTCQNIVDRRQKSGDLEIDDIDRVIQIELVLAICNMAEFLRYQ